MERPARTVAAVHDLSGVGRCALTVAIPVISAMGVQVCPAATAVLSAHTGFSDIEVMDMTPFLKRQLAAWGRMGLAFDAIYTGYLGSPAQAEIIGDFMDAQPGAMKIVDPVMGDEGRLYPGIDRDMAEAMLALCRRADVITPNLTEYAALTGEGYSDAPRTRAQIRDMLRRLPAKAAVITGIPFGEGMANACRDADGNVTVMPFDRVTCDYPGTGDMFASVLCGAMVRGEPLSEAVARAARYVSATLEASAEVSQDVNFGAQLERTLHLLTEGTP